MQTQYGNAIRSSKHILVNMRESVWAVYFHKLSTDSNPMHNFCTPKCPYKKAKAKGTLNTFKHTSNLPVAFMKTLKHVFKDLAKTDLLTKCLQGYTQNSNESIHNIIWKLP